MSDTPNGQLVPILTTDTPKLEQVYGQGEIINGTVDLRKTNPNLWRAVLGFAIINISLGFNFLIFHPVFLLWHQSNYLWSAIFLTLGTSKIVFLILKRNLSMVRLTMGAEIGYMMFLAIGATEPVLTNSASMQLPILYVGLAFLELPWLLEPFINPWTARRD